MNEFLIDKQTEREELDYEERRVIQERDYERLRKMTFYCFTNECLRDYILRYFGEYSGNYCGNCGSCLTEFEDIDVTEEAAAMIQLARTSGERYGINAIIDAVHGSDNAKVRQFRLNQNPYYGVLKSRTVVRIRHIMNDLLVKGYLTLTTGEYPIVKVTQLGRELTGEDGKEKKVILKLPKEREIASSAKKEKAKKSKTVDVKYPELFEQLRQKRMEIAKREHVPPYIVFSDKALREMSTFLPKTEEEMLGVNGVGKVKFEKYGEEFLGIVKKYAVNC